MQAVQHLRRGAAFFAQEGQQQVFGTNMLVIETGSFLTR